jgi:hypothetical protein
MELRDLRRSGRWRRDPNLRNPRNLCNLWILNVGSLEWRVPEVMVSKVRP